MKIDIENRSWSANSDEIHTLEGVKKLNEYYSYKLYHLLFDTKAIITVPILSFFIVTPI